ncbi:hypothetical protein N0V84_010297 [Fusarium piperis]|uniref:Protein kinase domain-containing protein n=1 Tax=Fusarium piperis TaxID=1435070 RepID=A0A9W8W4P5_9HYPO|nr:hypothetical protein N0V84_010297 [Fusarium piperis]
MDTNKSPSEYDNGYGPEPKLEIIEQSEAFAGKADNLVFHHTQLILKRGNDHFCAILKERVFKSEQRDIDSLDLVPIPREHFCPLFKQGLTVAPEPSSDIYVKRHCLVHWDPSDPNPETYGDLLVQEAEICEILSKHPHPNVVRYFGCLVEDNRITGLCLGKCTSKLSDKLADATPDERKMYCEGIEKGVAHLHQLGLIHNDLNPSNIMMDGDTPIIIDFDSCRPNGEKLGEKQGTLGWDIEDAEFATPENDFYSLEKIKQYIMDGGKVRDD